MAGELTGRQPGRKVTLLCVDIDGATRPDFNTTIEDAGLAATGECQLLIWRWQLLTWQFACHTIKGAIGWLAGRQGKGRRALT